MLNRPDDFRKIKSIKLVKSYFAYIWFEEADEFTDAKAVRQVLLSLFRNGQQFKVFYTFNTPFSTEHPLNLEWGAKPRYYYQHSTVYDLPKNIVPDETWEEIEDMKKTRPKEFAHVIMGEPGDPDAIIYPNIYRYTYSEDDFYWFDNIVRGLDFGYAPDPTAYVEANYDKTHNDLYIINEMYDYRLTSQQIANRVLDTMTNDGEITCELDKRVIDELNEAGLNCWPAKKGPNSRELGTKWFQELNHIYIDPVRTPNCWREFTTAEYARDKFGNVTSKIPDGNDHCLTGDTLVDTENGQIAIKDLCGKEGKVWSINSKGNKVLRHFKDVRCTRKNAKVYKITTIDGRCFKATEEHPVLTKEGWKPVRDLTENDEIVDIGGEQ